MAKVRFDMDDAWLVWAIPAHPDGTDLRGLISAADAVNHAIPTREQIVRTVNRGLRAGIIERAGGRFRVSPDTREALARATGTSRVWFRQWDAVYAYLSSREWQAVGASRYRLPERRYATVVEEYLKSL